MISPRKRALAVDLTLGVTAVVLGALTRGIPRSVAGVLIAGTGALVFVAALSVAEHTDVLSFINRTRPMSLVLVSAAFTAVGVAVIAGQGVVAVPSATLLWGMGVGLLCYRGWLGLHRPLPEKRLEQAELWGTPPEAEKGPPDRSQ